MLNNIGKKGSAESSTMVWVFVTLIIFIFVLGLVAFALFLTSEKQIKQAFFSKDEEGFIDLRGYESAENFLNQEIDGTKVSEFIVYSVKRGDLGKVNDEDLRYEDEINRDFRAFEVKIKNLLNELPKPVEQCGWGLIVSQPYRDIRNLDLSGPEIKDYYKSRIYLDKDLYSEIYLKCIGAYSGDL